MLQHPPIDGGPSKGKKFRIGSLTAAFSGPTSVQSYYVTPPFSPVPNKGGKLRPGYFTLAVSMLPDKGDKMRIGHSIPSPSRGPTSGRSYYVTPEFSAVPYKGDKIRIGFLTLAFSGDTSGRN